MNDKDKQRKVHLKNLLEVYSMEGIVELFSKIDKHIISLHEYSSEDFLNLNKDFKKYYKVANRISDNASYLFEFLAGQNNQHLPIDVEELYKHLDAKNDLMESHVRIADYEINRLLSQVRQAFFPIKNFKQNFTSLRFLETNLELDYNSNTGSETKILQNISSKAKDQLVLIEKSFQKLKLILKEDVFARNSNFNDEINIKDILNSLENELNYYQKHFKNARTKIPDIKEKTDQTKESISKIITNLQYHDIIKQKMQHIQTTHKDLINELDKINEQGDINDINHLAKYFIRIRDIAGLQAAQLMHTNKEYQTAIQRISDKFLEIGENMSDVAGQCTEYTSFDTERKQIFFDSLKENLSKTKSRIQQFCDFKKNFRHNIEVVCNLLNQVIKINKNITLLIDDVKKVIDTIKAETPDLGANEEKIFNQIQQLYNDLKSNKDNLDMIFSNINETQNTLEKNILTGLRDDQLEDETRELPEKVEEYINELDEVENIILEKLTENNELSESILSDIQKTVSNIKYYDYFENIVEGIINDLNTINYKLRFEEDDVKDKEDNLQKLTEYYTMNTEFVIHDQVTSGNADDIDVSEDGGDLELF